ncbi:MAG: carbohydrate ABC transporter permease [Defluviitaleaceae bacterium]|nr:carbohydrate ABC transporter permease [Defluviitaleaceae bacterium]MCL2276109.1 carbohydrate ABC transporter permease [Defluviitaleaceae bacterium]
MKRNDTIYSRIFDVFNVLFLIFFAAVTTLPFIYIIAGSFASQAEITARGFFLIPREPRTEAYLYILESRLLPRAMWISILMTGVGTAVSMFLTVTFAYPLSKKYLPGRNVMLALVVFTMLFSGGMIPTFLTVRALGLLNSFWALIIPQAISVWNLIVLMKFFQSIPEELEESARIDGATDWRVFLQIILPLSTAGIATFSLFYAVGYWNSFRPALLYLGGAPDLWPLQLVLRNIVLMAGGVIQDVVWDPDALQPPPDSIRNAVIVFATVPILLVYPFIQKHFTKGVMIGAIKG